MELQVFTVIFVDRHVLLCVCGLSIRVVFMFSAACYDFRMHPFFNCSNSEMFITVSAFILGSYVL